MMLTKEQLIDVGAEKLADVILSLYQNGPAVRKQLDIIFSAFDSNPNKIVSMIKKEIASLKRSSRFIDYKENASFAEKINKIRTHIKEDLSPEHQSPNQAIELFLSLLDCHDKIIEQVDDSSGRVGEVFQQACADLGAAYERVSNVNVKDVVKLVYDRFMNNGYCIYDNIICHFKAVLGDEGLKQLKLKFEQSVDGNNEDSYKNTTIKSGLQSIADCQNNVDAYIQACASFGELHEKDHLKIAKRLIKNQRGREAIEWLDKMSEDSYWQNDKMALKVEALNLCGDHQEAQAERQKWFDISLSSKVYNEILSHGEEDFIESFKKAAIEKALDFQDSNAALNFLIEIQEFDQASKLVYQKVDSIDGKKYHSLRPVAEILSKTHPLAATLLYRKMTEAPLEDAKSRSYHHAAKDLAVCDSLSSKITNWQGFKNHQLYFEELSVQHKRKRSFWTEYTFALSKRKTNVKLTGAKKQKTK